jgi:hypothetical protein
MRPSAKRRKSGDQFDVARRHGSVRKVKLVPVE